MRKISQTEACNRLCMCKSAHAYVHKNRVTEKQEDGTYRWLTMDEHKDKIGRFRFEYLDGEEWRTAKPISKGVRFNTGSELDIHGTKCYSHNAWSDTTKKWYPVVIVEGSFFTIYYVLDGNLDLQDFTERKELI